MKLTSIIKNINSNDKSFSCQWQSFLKESAKHKSERNFQGALPFEKETNK